METTNLELSTQMKDEILNDWKNGENIYLVVHHHYDTIAAKKLVFGNATATTGGRKIEWTPSGTSGAEGSDLEIPVGSEVSHIGLFHIGEAQTELELASTDDGDVTEVFTYGGIIRIDKVAITLT